MNKVEIIDYSITLLENNEKDLEIGMILGEEPNGRMIIKDYQTIGHQFKDLIFPIVESEIYFELIKPNDYIFGKLQLIIYEGYLFTKILWSDFEELDLDEYEKEKEKIEELEKIE